MTKIVWKSVLVFQFSRFVSFIFAVGFCLCDVFLLVVYSLGLGQGMLLDSVRFMDKGAQYISQQPCHHMNSDQISTGPVETK